jgi:DNA replication factor GINS
LDEFFQKLREIQKKERNLSGLAPVGENFYHEVSKYFNTLMRKIDNNPFSFESYLLRDAQRITAEIFERREHKISNSAVMNVQRSHQLFKESHSNSPTNVLKVPRNSTPEEEELYHALVDSLVNHREKMRGPLRFYASNLENEKSDVARETGSLESTEIESKSQSTDVESKTHLDKPKNSVKELKTESKGPNNGDTENLKRKDLKRFTAEEEAAIENDIYKEFGKEPFPGSTVSKDGSVSKGVSVSEDSAVSKSVAASDPTVSKAVTSSEHPAVSKDIPISEDAVLRPSGGKNTKAGDFEPANGNTDLKDKVNGQEIPTEILMVLEELPSIMGVDKKVYGPLSPQDIVTIPEPNARILIKNQKGKSIQKYK